MSDIDELRRLLAALTPEQIREGLARLDTPERRRELDQRLAPYRARDRSSGMRPARCAVHGCMARKQSRRSISIKGTVYERARRLLDQQAQPGEDPQSLSSVIEHVLNSLCDAHGVPEVDPSEVKHYPSKRTRPDTGEHISQHFTF